jgi:hypothetical protein
MAYYVVAMSKFLVKVTDAAVVENIPSNNWEFCSCCFSYKYADVLH